MLSKHAETMTSLTLSELTLTAESNSWTPVCALIVSTFKLKYVSLEYLKPDPWTKPLSFKGIQQKHRQYSIFQKDGEEKPPATKAKAKVKPQLERKHTMTSRSSANTIQWVVSAKTFPSSATCGIGERDVEGK